MIFTISNEQLTVKIKSLGAELHSFCTASGKEYLWSGDPAYWDYQSPLLFPLPGSCIDQTTLFDGVAHTMTNHGFLRDWEFTVAEQQADSITLEFTSNETTFACYPYHFTFSICFSLNGSTLLQSATIKNSSDRTMPFAFGGHMGFRCPLEPNETYSDYSIEFVKNEQARASVLKPEEAVLTLPEESFDISFELFTRRALIFETLTSNAVILKSKKSGNKLLVEYPNFNLIAFWSRGELSSPFICIEPWSGMSNKYTTTPVEFTEHTGLNYLEVGKTMKRDIKMTIFP